MHVLHVTSLLVTAATWLLAWWVGCRWCRGCAVRDRVSVWALGSILPAGGLVFAVHLPGYVSLFSGRGLVTPEPVAVIFLLITWAAHRVVARRFPQPAKPRDPEQPSFESGAFKLARLPVLVVAAMYGAFLLDALTRYPTGYDGLKYHLPVAVGWMQTRSMDLVAECDVLQALPENAMTVPFLLAFVKAERLIALMGVPGALLLAAVIYGLTRAINVGRVGSIAAVCVAMSIPMVVFQSFSSYIDLYAASSWLAALLALVWATKAPDDGQRRGLMFLAGLSAGIALGSKSTFLVLVPMLGLVAMVVEWIRVRDGDGDRARPIRNAVLFGLAALICSSFWFVRGTVQAGNPVYPLAVKVGEREILPGIDPGNDWFTRRPLAARIKRWWAYPWKETKYSGTGEHYSVNNALGAAYAAFVPLGIIAALLAAVRPRPRDPSERWRLVYLLVALSGVVLLLTSFHGVPRYVLPQIVLAVPVAAVLIDRLIARYPRYTFVLLTCALLITAAIASLSPIRSFLGRVKDNAWSRAAFYEIPPLIDKLEPGTRVLNLALPIMTYPVLGCNLSNDVISGVHWLALLAGDTISARTLRDHGIEYIFVREPWPDDWPDDMPLEKIFDDTETRMLMTTPATRVYRVLPHQGA